jgi:hypothetical protein
LSGYARICIQFGRQNLIRIRNSKTDPDPGGPKWPTKVKKIQVLWRDEDFSCSLDVLYGNLGISKLQYLIKANIDFISDVFIFFLQIFGHQNLESLLTKKCWVRSISRSSLKPMRIRNIKHIFLHEAAMGYLDSICYLLPFFSAIEPHLVCITQLHFLN